MYSFSNDQIYEKIDTIIPITELKDIYTDLMSECWSDMKPLVDNSQRSYIHCYLYYTKKIFKEDQIKSDSTLRSMYNAIRGFDDPTDAQSFIGKWAKRWDYESGTMFYFYAGPENCKSGNEESFQNIFKFIPNKKTLEKYQTQINLIKTQVDKIFDLELDQLMFTLLPVGSGLDWHVDSNMHGRLHCVVENDSETPSMIFKHNNKLTPIPATPGETYYANINIPHYVPLSNSPRLHLLGCVSKKEKDRKNDPSSSVVTRHYDLGKSKKSWADWKKELGVK